MQKRYCSCGRQIFVSFNFSRAQWRAVFYDAGASQRRAPTNTCPGCGAPLHIDRVR